MLFIPGAGELLLPGVPPLMGLLASGLVYLMWLGQIGRYMDDALGLTVKSELVRITVNVAAMLVLLLLFAAGALNLALLFLHQYLLYALLFLGYLWCLRGVWPRFGLALAKEEREAYRGEFARFTMPLFAQALASLVFLTAERWMLQHFDGSAAQGYFSLSQKVGMACFLFVTAMTPLIMREFALAHGRADRRRMADLLDRHGPMLYGVAAYFSCFVMVEAESVVRLFGGAEFAAATLPVQIMALYPLHQSYGQVVSSVFLATGETRVLRNNTVLSLVAGMFVSWFLLAPASLGGLNLGSTGLAVKTVSVQFVFVNILLYRCAKSIPLRLAPNLAHQALCPLAFIALAWLSAKGSELSGVSGMARFFLSGMAYSAGSLLLSAAFPPLAGLRRADVNGLWRLVRNIASRFRKG
jgi:O-antigen/teichoic acid export membrane protein